MSYIAKEGNSIPIEDTTIKLGVALEDIGWNIIKSKNQTFRMRNGKLKCFTCALEAIKEDLEDFLINDEKFDWIKEINHIYREKTNIQTQIKVDKKLITIMRKCTKLINFL